MLFGQRRSWGIRCANWVLKRLTLLLLLQPASLCFWTLQTVNKWLLKWYSLKWPLSSSEWCAKFNIMKRRRWGLTTSSDRIIDCPQLRSSRCQKSLWLFCIWNRFKRKGLPKQDIEFLSLDADIRLNFQSVSIRIVTVFDPPAAAACHALDDCVRVYHLLMVQTASSLVESFNSN